MLFVDDLLIRWREWKFERVPDVKGSGLKQVVMSYGKQGARDWGCISEILQRHFSENVILQGCLGSICLR